MEINTLINQCQVPIIIMEILCIHKIVKVHNERQMVLEKKVEMARIEE